MMGFEDTRHWFASFLTVIDCKTPISSGSYKFTCVQRAFRQIPERLICLWAIKQYIFACSSKLNRETELSHHETAHTIELLAWSPAQLRSEKTNTSPCNAQAQSKN